MPSRRDARRALARGRAREWLVACASCAAALWLACAVNPVTGRTELSLVSEEQEIAIGMRLQPQIDGQLGRVNDPVLQMYVAGIGARMAAASERPQLPWMFTVVDDSTVNAFAIPGGFLNVTRGILAYLSTEAQLAGVLGHEIGHVTARHSARQMSRQGLVNAAAAIPSVIDPALGGIVQLAGSGFGILLMSYGRDDERQSDELALRYMTSSGYDPQGLVEVMEVLDATSLAAGKQGLPEWLSSHPAPANRLSRIRSQIAAEGLSGTEGDDPASFVPRLDGLVFGEDPRQGYFEDERFVHAGLGFELTLPSGWQAVNTPAALVAKSPDGRALIQLDVADEPTTEAAEQVFFSVEGVEATKRSAGQQGGFPARSAHYQANVAQGVFTGSVLFLDAGPILQLIALADPDGWATHRNAMLGSLGTFQRLGEAEIRAAEPWRLRIAILPRPLSPEAFLDAHPGPVDAATLARLNQVAPNGRIPAGVPVKWVEGRKRD